jgi:cathepsin L
MGFAPHFQVACAFIAPALVFTATVQRESELPSFASFIAEHGRQYTAGSAEFEQRRKIYENSVEMVQSHNAVPDRLWSKEINHLSDRTEAELAQLRGLRVMSLGKNGKVGRAVSQHTHGQFLHQIKNSVVPDEKSWTHLTSVQRDTNQGGCGSCWAVATATVLSANAEINGYNNSFFSAQELVSCTPNPHHCGGTGGCSGSTVELAMNWVGVHGCASEHHTPYQESDTACQKTEQTAFLSGVDNLEHMIAVGFHKVQSGGARIGLKGWTRLEENAYEPLLKAVAHTGPTAISVAADTWNAYGEGILDDCNKDAVINHAVVLIGYGKDRKRDNTPYWLIKNSWGLSWGENGNIRILRHTGNTHCGTDYQPEVGTGCDGGPSSVKVCGMCGILYDSVVPHFKPAWQ